MDKQRTIDQELISELLEEEIRYQEKKEEKPQQEKKANPFTENFSKKTTPLTESAILSGLDQHGIPKDFISQSMHWVQQNPVETILGAIVIGGIGYKLYQHFSRKPNPETEQAMKNRFSRERKKRKRERRRSFMEKAKDLFHSENEEGERKIDLGKTVTAVSVAAAGALAGVIASKKSLPVSLMGAASLAVSGYALNSPLVTLGAIGLAVGAFVSELVRKTVKRNNAQPEEPDTDIFKATQQEMLEGFRLAEATIQQQLSNQQTVDELNHEQEALRKRRPQEQESRKDFGEPESFELEELPELA